MKHHPQPIQQLIISGAQATYGVFPDRYQVGPPDTSGRVMIVDPKLDRRWLVGRPELFVARSFDGGRTYLDIMAVLESAGKRRMTEAAIRQIEARLLRLGLLEDRQKIGTSTQARWPVRLRLALASTNIAVFDPSILLEWCSGPITRLTTRTCVLLMMAYVIAAFTVLDLLASTFFKEITSTLAGLGVLYLIIAFIAASVFHEGGHALACRKLGISIERVGIGLRWLVPFAWTRPDQDAWQRLPVGARVLTAIAGPLGGLVFSALGATLWLGGYFGQLDWARAVGLYIVLAGTLGMAPTLLPVFKGDAYLLLEIWLRHPNLHQRSFNYLTAAIKHSQQDSYVSYRRRILYVSFALGAALGTAAITGAFLWGVYWFAIASHRGG
jgi:putative peptide zinc metalloprotease protein